MSVAITSANAAAAIRGIVTLGGPTDFCRSLLDGAADDLVQTTTESGRTIAPSTAEGMVL
jgi:hypothetical protein